jgi:hypothetical protein
VSIFKIIMRGKTASRSSTLPLPTPLGLQRGGGGGGENLSEGIGNGGCLQGVPRKRSLEKHSLGERRREPLREREG